MASLDAIMQRAMEAAMKEYANTPPLYLAACDGNERLFVDLLQKPQHRAKLKDTCLGHDCLQSAIVQDNKEVAGKDPHLGRNAMHHAGHVPVGRTPLHHGTVKPNEMDKEGRNPLSLTAQYGNEGIVKALLDLETAKPGSVTLDSVDSAGNSPLYYAVRYGNDSIAQLLAGTKKVNLDVKERAEQDKRSDQQKGPAFEWIAV
ncbi:ankyrin repeat PH and SEC7 domain protein [Fusarium beomiforme]|uniref:Ankyrin repeat PH and SEC7 domain protein n=1 Tax=Fusarium beomiforme TaxID=44412 RepID=A0A9P5E0U1_9HYPO|nr:ankyrin repeat PH and SEC7 domain protein [Fusarium beomiforme]